MPKDIQDITLRRQLQQTIHCLEEALAVLSNGEDLNLADQDVQQAMAILGDYVAPKILNLLRAKEM